MTSAFRFSMFHWETFSGMVSFFATSNGMPTSLMSSDGSGLMTVRLEKSTLFPESEPLKRPSLPFSLWLSVLSGLPERWCACGIPETSLSK